MCKKKKKHLTHCLWNCVECSTRFTNRIISDFNRKEEKKKEKNNVYMSILFLYTRKAVFEETRV